MVAVGVGLWVENILSSGGDPSSPRLRSRLRLNRTSQGDPELGGQLGRRGGGGLAAGGGVGGRRRTWPVSSANLTAATAAAEAAAGGGGGERRGGRD